MTDEPAAEDLPAYVIEGARSSRASCKACRRKIDQGTLRLGTLIEGRFGTGYMWEHLQCAARRSISKVEEAYAASAWDNAKVPPEDVPELSDLRQLAEQADKKRSERKQLPYAERAASGRSRCKHSGDEIPKGSIRVVLAREVTFGNQVRQSPINVLPQHVAEALAAEDNGTDVDGFEEALRANSADLTEAELIETLAEIGPLE